MAGRDARHACSKDFVLKVETSRTDSHWQMLIMEEIRRRGAYGDAEPLIYENEAGGVSLTDWRCRGRANIVGTIDVVCLAAVSRRGAAGFFLCHRRPLRQGTAFRVGAW